VGSRAVRLAIAEGRSRRSSPTPTACLQRGAGRVAPEPGGYNEEEVKIVNETRKDPSRS